MLWLSFLSTRKTVIPLVVEICNNFSGIYVIAAANLKYKNIFNCTSIVYSHGGVIKINEKSKMNNSLLEISYSW